MHRLVALDVAASDLFVSSLQRCFDAGDAVFPVDQRLPEPARKALFASMRPSAVIDKDGTETALPDGLPVEEGDALVVATSGTTGHPRGVVLTHDALLASATATGVRLGVNAASDHWLCCLPVAHIGGLSVITRALLSGTKLTTTDRFSPDIVIAALREGATLTSLVPTALGRLDPETVAAFRSILLGGSQIPATRPKNTVATYGMTESGSGVVYNGLELDNVEVRVTDGELLVRAPMLLRCYRDGTDPKDAGGWFHTGDAGGFLDDGRVYVEGRIAEVIVSGGEKIWPTAVEEILATSPKIKDVAVAGKDDPEWGQRVVAYVVANSDYPPITLDELRDLVRSTLGSIAAPRELVLLSELPRTAIGKIRRNALAEAG